MKEILLVEGTAALLAARTNTLGSEGYHDMGSSVVVVTNMEESHVFMPCLSFEGAEGRCE